ncbi:excisionase family protein [Leptolyngbya sp. 7M]|nr:excisionase family protein [Leptolyngbya sp. 7M]
MSPSNSSAGISLHNHEPFRFVKKREISKLTGLSGDTLKKYRLSGLLCEDIHWIRINSKVVLYNLPLMLDWLQNIHDPQAHQRAIEAYMTSLLSRQRSHRCFCGKVHASHCCPLLMDG